MVRKLTFIAGQVHLQAFCNSNGLSTGVHGWTWFIEIPRFASIYPKPMVSELMNLPETRIMISERIFMAEFDQKNQRDVLKTGINFINTAFVKKF